MSCERLWPDLPDSVPTAIATRLLAALRADATLVGIFGDRIQEAESADVVLSSSSTALPWLGLAPIAEAHDLRIAGGAELTTIIELQLLTAPNGPAASGFARQRLWEAIRQVLWANQELFTEAGAQLSMCIKAIERVDHSGRLQPTNVLLTQARVQFLTDTFAVHGQPLP